MRWLAVWIARRIWWGALWLMRRRWMRALQTSSMRWMGPERNGRARRHLVRQNAFARRIGLRLLTTVVLVVLASLALQTVYAAALYLVESGTLRPRSLREPQ